MVPPGLVRYCIPGVLLFLFKTDHSILSRLVVCLGLFLILGLLVLSSLLTIKPTSECALLRWSLRLCLLVKRRLSRVLLLVLN